MGFGLGGGLGINETRKHVEGTLINPETSMEGISSKKLASKKPWGGYATNPWEEMDYYQEMLGRVQVQTTNQLAPSDKAIIDNAKSYYHASFDPNGVGQFSAEYKKEAKNDEDVMHLDGEIKQPKQTISNVLENLSKAEDIKAFEYTGADDKTHLYVVDDKASKVKHYIANKDTEFYRYPYKSGLYEKNSIQIDKGNNLIHILIININ